MTVRVLPKVLSYNWQLKLSAIALAALLWTVPRFETPSRQTLPGLPVRVQLNDPSHAVVGIPLPGTVDVTFSGPARQLFSLAANRPTVIVPIDQVSALDTVVTLQFPWVRMPDHQGVVAEAFNPAAVSLSFEPIDVRGLPPSLRVVGSLLNGQALSAEPEISVEFILVSGPASRVAALASIPLEPLDLARLAGSGSYSLAVDTTGLSGLAFSPPTVTVLIRTEEGEEVSVPGIPVEFETEASAEGMSVRPDRVTLDLSGARSQLEAVEMLRLRVVIPDDDVLSLAPAEERQIALRIIGLPSLVRAEVRPDSVLVRRIF